MSNKKIAIVSAVPETLLAFMSKHLEALAHLYSVTAICGGSTSIPQEKLVPSVTYIDVAIERRISPLKDLASLFGLLQCFRSNHFFLVQSITPKAGLLAMLAAWLCGVPLRVHVFTGQVWVTKKGLSRWFLKRLDKLIASLATSLLADSASQKQFLVAEGIALANQIEVLGNGSICGVDTARFAPNQDVKLKLRNTLKIPSDAVLALFLGRLKRDKGVLDLATAFGALDSSLENLYLAFVGPDEDNLTAQISKLAGVNADRIRFVGSVNNAEDFLAAANFLCLPSYREGFGLVTIEAAAVGIPTLASRIYGITDAVVDGVTGILHDPGDYIAIEKGLRELALNPLHCKELGSSAKRRAIDFFSSSLVVDAHLHFYKRLISESKSRA